MEGTSVKAVATCSPSVRSLILKTGIPSVVQTPTGSTVMPKERMILQQPGRNLKICLLDIREFLKRSARMF